MLFAAESSLSAVDTVISSVTTGISAIAADTFSFLGGALPYILLIATIVLFIHVAIEVFKLFLLFK